MKTNTLLLFVLSLAILLPGCRSAKNKPKGSAAIEAALPTGNRGETNIEDWYLSLPSMEIPLAAGPQFLQSFRRYKRIGKPEIARLNDIRSTSPFFGDSARVVRLPEYKGLRFILIGDAEVDLLSLELYSLSEDLEPRDHLRLSSVDSLDGGKGVITGTFTINEGYRTAVSKFIGGTLIERLTYTPSTEGIFEELRDGSTVTVAYDSYDGLNYIVESFTWDRIQSGGLIKNSITKENYRIGRDGLIKADQTTE